MKPIWLAMAVSMTCSWSASAQEAQRTAPVKPSIAADLAISDKMVIAPSAIDLDVKIKPNTKPVKLRQKGIPKEVPCGTVSTLPCRTKTGITVFGSKGF